MMNEVGEAGIRGGSGVGGSQRLWVCGVRLRMLAQDHIPAGIRMDAQP